MIPVLRGPRVTLRGFTWADFPAFADMWQERVVAEHIPFAPIVPSQNWARFNMNNSNWVHKGYGSWAVVDGSGQFLGTVSLFNGAGNYGADYDEAIQAGWVFAPHSHGQGYASEAAGLAHGWLDQQKFGGRSVCGMAPEHKGSIRVAEKTGYSLLRLSEDKWGKVQLMERVRQG